MTLVEVKSYRLSFEVLMAPAGLGLNPRNHRADISAQANLKPSKKDKKMSQNCFFQIHYKEFFGDSEKNTHFVFEYLVRILRGLIF
jgi:hypothetical protein